MKAYGVMDVYIHVFLTSALDGGERSASRPGTHWKGGWVDPRAGLDDMKEWKFLTLPGLELRPPRSSSQSSRYTDCAIPAH
jgi:hypothetical protein